MLALAVIGFVTALQARRMLSRYYDHRVQR
jgi:hypothetical protein